MHCLQGLGLGDALGLAAFKEIAREFLQQRAGGRIHQQGALQGEPQGFTTLGHGRRISQQCEFAKPLVKQQLRGLQRAVLPAFRQHDVALQRLGAGAETLHP